MSKVFEHIFKDKLLAYISANHLQYPNQYSFVSKRSVVSNLLISNSIFTKSQNRSIPVDIISFDFSKAIDRVPHSLLRHRFKLFGIVGSFLFWLTDFFSARLQRVFVGGHLSSFTSVLSGVIQGSVLGPAFYSICSNSIST